MAPDSAFILTSDKPIADYFEQALQICSNAKALCNWIIVEFAGRFKDSGKSILNSGIPASHLANLINMIDKGTITGRMAKDVADDMLQHPGKDPVQIVAENPDYSPVSDHGEIEKIVNQVLAENPQSIIDFKAGRDKATKGKAPPTIVNEMLRKKIEAS